MNETLIAEIAHQIVEGEILYNWRFYLTIFGLVVVGTVPSSFLVAYFRTRGERYATKADFDGLLNELRETTRATEGIKQNISHDAWLKQRKWELRREAYFKLLASFQKLQVFDGLRLAELDIAGQKGVSQEYSEFIQRIKREHFDQFLETQELVVTAMAVVSSEAYAVLMDYWRRLSELSKVMVSEENVRDQIAQSQDIAATTFAKILKIAQKEFSEIT
jgi:hypothetical protein